MMHWSVATVADILGREVIIPACFPRFVIPVTSGKTTLLKVQGVSDAIRANQILYFLLQIAQ